MGRRKIRHYYDRDYYRTLFNNYFNAHNDEVMQEVLRQTGFDTVKALSEAEYYSYFGLDCGWIVLTPMNKEQAHEWFLDDDRISSKMFVHNPCYNCQSTTIQEIMIRKALKDLNLESEFYVSVRLD